MHEKRYNHLTPELYELAVSECFHRKWRRRDILSFVEKYAGIPRSEIILEELTGSRKIRNEAIKSVALYLQEIVEELLLGHEPEDMEPVKIRKRPDGMTGKMRDIALLCILHQLLGHLAKLMLDPLFSARLLPTQHASIPGRGQTLLKDQAHRYFLKESLGIKYQQKTDVVHAYASLKYSVVISIVRRELPHADDLMKLLSYLEKLAPDGHLIIGGYIDAWLFNFAMSYAIRYVYTLGTTRRGKFVPYVKRCVSFMDDFALLSASIKGLKRAIPALNAWMKSNLGVELKLTTGIIKMLSIEEEQRRKTLSGKAERGVPVLDMAGFRIARSHVTIRPRVFLRARRQFLRGYRELKATGTLSRSRAGGIIAYHGYVKQTDSEGLKKKYHVAELMKTAITVTAFYSRLDHRKRKEDLYALQKRRSGNRPEPGRDREPPGREDARPARGQCEEVPDRRGAETVPF